MREKKKDKSRARTQAAASQMYMRSGKGGHTKQKKGTKHCCKMEIKRNRLE